MGVGQGWGEHGHGGWDNMGMGTTWGWRQEQCMDGDNIQHRYRNSSTRTDMGTGMMQAQ